MSTALRVLRPDYTRCSWCVIARVNVTSTDPFFFSLGKVVNILHVKWHFKAILLIFFTNMSKGFCFSVVYELG